MPTPLSAIAFQQLHGAASRVGVEDTAFPHRYDHHSFYIHPATDDPADSPKMINWARACWEAVHPLVEQAMYVNGLEDALEEGEHRIREVYGTNYDRLLGLKNKYDPTNFFRLNANIKPTV
jgi:FAD/FMN-containing dehydrogenase